MNGASAPTSLSWVGVRDGSDALYVAVCVLAWRRVGAFDSYPNEMSTHVSFGLLFILCVGWAGRSYSFLFLVLLAVQRGELEEVRRCLLDGVSANCRDEHGWTLQR